jgi:hypothetical protein
VTRCTFFALVAMIASVGCVRHAHPVPVRPAANAAGDDALGPFFFPPPFALAVPEDAVVRVVGSQMTCSGTLVEDDLVLTAHHCMVERGPHGEFVKKLVSPDTVRIELGGDYLAWGNVGIKAIVAPPCGEAGGAGDVAVLVLARKLVGMGTMSPRLDAPPMIGEVVDPVGFGRCALSPDGIRRKTRMGGTVMATTGETFILSASICPGDSGGPVLSRGSREVVGVVSLSAMDGDERTTSPSIMSRIDPFRAVFSAARLIADGTDPHEVPPLSCDN